MLMNYRYMMLLVGLLMAFPAWSKAVLPITLQNDLKNNSVAPFAQSMQLTKGYTGDNRASFVNGMPTNPLSPLSVGGQTGNADVNYDPSYGLTNGEAQYRYEHSFTGRFVSALLSMRWNLPAGSTQANCTLDIATEHPFLFSGKASSGSSCAFMVENAATENRVIQITNGIDPSLPGTLVAQNLDHAPTGSDWAVFTERPTNPSLGAGGVHRFNLMYYPEDPAFDDTTGLIYYYINNDSSYVLMIDWKMSSVPSQGLLCNTPQFSPPAEQLYYVEIGANSCDIVVRGLITDTAIQTYIGNHYYSNESISNSNILDSNALIQGQFIARQGEFSGFPDRLNTDIPYASVNFEPIVLDSAQESTDLSGTIIYRIDDDSIRGATGPLPNDVIRYQRTFTVDVFSPPVSGAFCNTLVTEQNRNGGLVEESVKYQVDHYTAVSVEKQNTCTLNISAREPRQSVVIYLRRTGGTLTTFYPLFYSTVGQSEFGDPLEFLSTENLETSIEIYSYQEADGHLKGAIPYEEDFQPFRQFTVNWNLDPSQSIGCSFTGAVVREKPDQFDGKNLICYGMISG